MSEMQIFNNAEFGQVRTTLIDGQPWFVAGDVCKYFDVTNRNRIMQQIDDDEKGGTQIETPGGMQNVTIISESGLYTLLFALQPTKGRGVSESHIQERVDKVRRFKRWVTHDVLPSIRKHGMYATPKTMEQMLNDPDFAIRLLQEIKSERQKNSVLEAKKNELEAKIEEDRPMTEFGIAISTSEGCVTIAQFSALLCQKGVDTGEKRMFAEMREDGFLNSTGSYYNKPAQRFLDNKTMEYKVYKNKFTNQVTFQPLITPKGIQYFMDYYLRKHGKLPLLTVHRRTVIEKRPNYKQQRTEQQVKMSDINNSI